MNAATRLAAFGAAAVVVLGGGAALGAAVGPAPASTAPTHLAHEEDPMATTDLAEHTGHTATGTAADYRIERDTTVLAAGTPQRITFRVLGPTDAPVTSFELRHERTMHLIVVSHDLVSYAHVHPELDADGTWSVEIPALPPGGYRLIADAAPTDGPDLVLPFDLLVPGTATGVEVPAPAPTATVDDLEVTLQLTSTGDERTAALTVRRDGALVAPDPYLGARGHLVAIDAADLSYLHVHPDDGGAGTDAVTFAVAAPRPGRYRLFFDFSVDGQVRTAAFTVDLTDDATTPATDAPTSATEDHEHAPGEEHP